MTGGPEGLTGVVDLTLPVIAGQGRFGLDTQFETPITFDDANWQGSVFRMFAHSGTHVDAPVHFIRGALTIEQAPLDRLIGRGWLFDLTDRGAGDPIDARRLDAADPGLQGGDMAVLRTDWTDKHWGDARFVDDSPFLTLDGAQWLVDRGVKAIVYDFSEEYIVRKPGFRGEECEVHHLILGSGVWNIEYVTNLGALKGPAVTIVALPLKLSGLDGSPARVIAFEQ
ncbi:MAG: arylformamidase [bacterium]|jgi:kynurenine formamidase|nr:arylformamidase [Solirubrobacteraceae bacterium]